jgi:O-methyltransferase
VDYNGAVLTTLKIGVKHALIPWRYRYPAPQLGSAKLYLYFDSLYQTREVPGAVVEVGCFQGSTAVFACRFLRDIGCARRYLCVDTFSGFTPSQWAEDEKLGTFHSLRRAFAANSKSLVRRLVKQWGCPSIELLEADITALDESALPEQISVALIDVDLAVPTTAALKKIAPRMTPGGVILIDDCEAIEVAGFMGARVAADQFGDVEYRFGMGVIRIPVAEPSLPQ